MSLQARKPPGLIRTRRCLHKFRSYSDPRKSQEDRPLLTAASRHEAILLHRMDRHPCGLRRLFRSAARSYSRRFPGFHPLLIRRGSWHTLRMPKRGNPSFCRIRRGSQAEHGSKYDRSVHPPHAAGRTCLAIYHLPVPASEAMRWKSGFRPHPSWSAVHRGHRRSPEAASSPEISLCRFFHQTQAAYRSPDPHSRRCPRSVPSGRIQRRCVRLR